MVRRKLKRKANDDVCHDCGECGSLLCCDECERAYHLECLGLKEADVPEGSWACPQHRTVVETASHASEESDFEPTEEQEETSSSSEESEVVEEIRAPIRRRRRNNNSRARSSQRSSSESAPAVAEPTNTSEPSTAQVASEEGEDEEETGVNFFIEYAPNNRAKCVRTPISSFLTKNCRKPAAKR